MRAFLVCAAVLAMAGCNDNGIGRKCIDSTTDGGTITGPQFSSPALECPTRLCLIEPGQNGNPTRSTCTFECQTNDDCNTAVTGQAMNGLCDTNFVCAVATVAGDFKCKKVCICKGDLECGVNSDENGNPITPPSCPNPSPTPNCPAP